ncbi:hypothetical protein [Streptomyces sp. NPDC051704]|uniref:hypothetical protein n=1 Tax=Streptomyces sp. NPDC051704 TaxID=3365671 RepID=UPI003788DA52
MTRPAQRTAQRAVRWPRLLLLAALLLGIVTMHTLGHPSRSHTMEDAAPVAAVAPAARAAGHTSGHTSDPSGRTAAGRAADLAPDLTPEHTADHVTGRTPERLAAGDRAPAAGAPLPGSGMDPMSVCLAVLGGLTLLILGAGPAGLRDAAPLGGAARAPGRSGGPDPPSPREILTRLAVLRV